jgi:hypothetical protein
MQRTIDQERLVHVAGLLALQGFPEGRDILVEFLSEEFPVDGSLDVHTAAISALNQYYSARDEEEEGAGLLVGIIENLVRRDNIEDNDKAYLYNQMAMIQNGAELYSEAVANIKKAIEYKPTEPS